jgi:lysyl-tRNA synthetase class 1
MKGSELTEEDSKEIELRTTYAKRWLETSANDDFKFTLSRDSVPTLALSFSDEVKSALKHVLAYADTHTNLNGAELHAALHDIRKEHDLDAKVFFGALYTSFLGKTSGPKAGWFLSVLEREFLLRRLKEVSI